MARKPLNVKPMKDLAALRKRIAELEARNLILYKTLESMEMENKAQAAIIRRSGLTEYQPPSFREKHELMGARQPKYIKTNEEY